MSENPKAERTGDGEAPDLTRGTVGADDATGAAAGAAAGALGGAAAGPGGALLGGVAGGLAGFLAGSRLQGARELSRTEDEHYRRVHTRMSGAGMPYEHVRDLYRLGRAVRESEEFGGRDWRTIEPALSEAWTAAQRETWGEWPEARSYVRRGFEEQPGPA